MGSSSNTWLMAQGMESDVSDDDSDSPNKSSCVSSLELVCVGSVLNLVVCNYFIFAEMQS